MDMSTKELRLDDLLIDILLDQNAQPGSD